MPDETNLAKQEGVEPIVPSEVLDKLPPAVRQQVILMMSSHRYGTPDNPLANKVTSDHITTLLDNSEKDSQREFNAKWFTLAYVVLALSFLTFICFYLPTIDKELFKEVLKLLLTFLAGLGAGFGVSKLKKAE